MTQLTASGSLATCFALLCLAGAPARAQDRPAASAPAPAAGWATVPDDGLAEAAGKGDVRQVVSGDLKAGVQGNSIGGDVSSGGVAFGQASLQGANGLFIVNANTGSNVAINAALSVNVVITP